MERIRRSTFTVIGVCLLYLFATKSLVESSSIVRNEAVEQKMFGEDCNTDDECVETQFCSKLFGRCDCPTQNSKWLGMYFLEDTRTCVNSVGKACTLEKDFMLDFLCGPNAVCKDTEDMTLPANFGVCKCKDGYIKDIKGHKCILGTDNGSDEGSSESNGNANVLFIDSLGRARQAIAQEGDGTNLEDDEDDEGDYSDEVLSTDLPKGLSETDMTLQGDSDDDSDETSTSGTSSLNSSCHLSLYMIVLTAGLVKYMNIFCYES